jgi:RNA recognition motif-containing protein
MTMATGTRLYVGNLTYGANESSLRSVFEQEGRKVVEVKVVTDRETGVSVESLAAPFPD